MNAMKTEASRMSRPLRQLKSHQSKRSSINWTIIIGLVSLMTYFSGLILLSQVTPVAGDFASSATSSYVDGFSGDLFGPDTIYVSRSICCVNTNIASYFPRLPTAGLPVGSIISSINGGFALGGRSGFTLRGAIGIYNYQGVSPSWVVIKVTDGYSTIYKNITVVFTSGYAMWPGSTLLLDSARGGYYGSIFNNPLVGRMENSFQLQPSNQVWSVNFSLPYFQVETGLYTFANTLAATPLNQHYGRYNATFKLGDSSTEVYPMFIIAEQDAIVKFSWSQTLYTNMPIGTSVGTMSWFSDSGINAINFGTTLFAVQLSTGLMNTNGTLTAGTGYTLDIYLTSYSGRITHLSLTYDILVGTTLPSSALTFQPNSLDNQHRGQQVGQPVVNGFTPTTWTLFNRNNILDPYGGQMNLFEINSTTGFVYCPSRAKLPGRTHQITITAADGPHLVTAVFNVTVTQVVGPVYHVGRNMSAVYPGTGYEHFYQLLPLISAGQPNGDLPDARAGYTVNFHYDFDPDYYANDNGLSTHDYNLRYGIAGPGTFQSADLNGPRPRLGGFVNSPSGGGDMGGKGFFNLMDGDITIRGLEISFVNGDGSPDTDQTHGISGIRKNAAVWGDFIMEDSYVHDCNNGLESGSGPYDVYLRRNVFANGGTQYVSSGATHNNYLGANGYIEVTDSLYYHTINGHNLKTRAFSGLIVNNRFYDGETGGASAQIDMPNGGLYTITNNDIFKGPNAQSYSAILFGEEGTGTGRPHSLTVKNNRICVVMPDHSNFGSGVAISAGKINFGQWTPGTMLIDSNQYFLNSPTTQNLYVNGVYGDSPGVNPIFTMTNNVQLTQPFPLNFTDPTIYATKATKAGFLVRSYDGNGHNFKYFDWGLQINLVGQEDMRLQYNSSVGTPIGQAIADGSIAWLNSPNTTNQLLAHPFPNRAANWSLAAGYSYYNGLPYNLAPLDRYAIDPTSGLITLAKPLTTCNIGADLIVVQAVIPSGPFIGLTCWFRFYVAVVSDSTPPPCVHPTSSSSSSTGGSSSKVSSSSSSSGSSTVITYPSGSSGQNSTNTTRATSTSSSTGASSPTTRPPPSSSSSSSSSSTSSPAGAAPPSSSSSTSGSSTEPTQPSSSTGSSSSSTASSSTMGSTASEVTSTSGNNSQNTTNTTSSPSSPSTTSSSPQTPPSSSTASSSSSSSLSSSSSTSSAASPSPQSSPSQSSSSSSTSVNSSSTASNTNTTSGRLSSDSTGQSSTVAFSTGDAAVTTIPSTITFIILAVLPFLRSFIH